MPRIVWEGSQAKEETGGIWHQVSAIDPEPIAPGKYNIWTVLGNRPGGMWQELEGETLYLGSSEAVDIWEEVGDETLIIRPRLDIWQQPNKAPGPKQSSPSVWEDVGDETLLVTPPEESVWDPAALPTDYTNLKPSRRLGWALKELETARGEEYYILKNTRLGTYLRLTEQQVFLWNLMDGQHTIRDMAVAYFIEYQSLAIQGLLVFLGQLHSKGFLNDVHTNVYANTARALGQGGARTFGRRLWRAFTQTTFSIRGIDRIITALYKGGVKLIFTGPIQIAILLATLAGLVAFGIHVQSGTYSVLTGAGEYLTIGLVGLYVAQFLAVFIHEAAHAFTCKHYGREVPRAGFMIYLGMPAFFVETTDIWMEPRRPRILVTWAGPYSGFFLAGAASLLIFVTPSVFVGGLMYQFAFACISLSFANLNPLLMLDGYFILMDWLEMPMLRARAMNFVAGDLWRKLRGAEQFEREDRIFAIFGILSVLWTVLAVFSILKLLGKAVLSFLQNQFGPEIGLALSVALAIGLALLLLWPILRRFATRTRAQAMAG